MKGCAWSIALIDIGGFITIRYLQKVIKKTTWDTNLGIFIESANDFISSVDDVYWFCIVY